MFHRAADIVTKVAAGDIDLGVTGLDLVREFARDEANLLVIDTDLGYARADLVLAVPEAWVDVQNWQDVADLAAEWAATGKQLRVATKYANLVRSFLYEKGVYSFSLIDSQGATEAAPALGYADIIADITETGTAMRENRLKIVAGTTILRSQACLIGSRASLSENKSRRATVSTVLELLESRRRARSLAQIIANVPGQDAASVAAAVSINADLKGLQGPTIASVFPSQQDVPAPAWFSVSVVVASDRMLPAVEYLRSIGSTGIIVLPVQYAFADQSATYGRLLTMLDEEIS
ncbi:MAG: ATP phosphoribosyltransferase [Herpetosiphon sp.]